MALIRTAFASLLLAFGCAAASAQTPDPEGRWALIADGRPLAILELRRDPAAPGGWTGAWIRPERMTISQTHAAFEIGGPLVRRTVVDARKRDGLLELAVEGRAGQAPSRHTFRLTGADHAELGWIDSLAIPPVPLIRTDEAAAVSRGWDSERTYAIATPRPSNAEMRAIFEADQADRRPAAEGGSIDWAAVAPRDEARRARTMALLEAGALQSGDDFWHAAFVFQHGGSPESYLLAHTLATVAAARGRPDAAWIAAASLDRYLQSIGQPQIYGTQYGNRDGNGWTQEPYDRDLVSDALRAALGVPAQAAQEQRRADMEAQRRSAN